MASHIHMARPVTLFTGQWADLPLEKLAEAAAEMGYDGLELACWGDHFDVLQAGNSKYLKEKWELLADHKLDCFSISNHLGSGRPSAIPSTHATKLFFLSESGETGIRRASVLGPPER